MSDQNYIWKNGCFIEKEEASINLMSHAFHYGTSVFEGIRAYKADKGTAVLKLVEHMKRFEYSMKSLNMPIHYSVEQMCEAVINTVKKNGYDACYIRPVAYYGESSFGISPKENTPVEVMIICAPMGRFMSADSLDICVSKYIRIHPDSTICDAKIAGHYVNSMLATMECIGTHYHESLLLDIEGNVAEGPAQNIFIVRGRDIITTPLGTILAGITRDLVIQIAKENKYNVKEEYFKVEDIMGADEAFFTGSAAEIMPIRSINDQKIGQQGDIGSVTQEIRKYFQDITRGKVSSNALTYVN